MKRQFFGTTQPTLPVGMAKEQNAPANLLMTVADTPAAPRHVPALEPRDEAVFLLTAAAEIEHALMVQYLFAAYSVRVPATPPQSEPKKIQDVILQITREEMGHFITVQNLLHLIGGPLNFDREHLPYASELYPFRFKLEQLTLPSLAKYVVAESPKPLPADMTDDDQRLYDETIVPAATQANDGEAIHHVGPIFARLEKLFRDELKEEDFRLDSATLQAVLADWGYAPRGTEPGEALLIETFTGAAVMALRHAAAEAVHKIGQQGEGFDPTAEGKESHFERFFAVYKKVRGLPADSPRLTWLVSENPNTSPPPDQPISRAKMVETITEAHASKGRITASRTLNWAHLFNLRYRLLLSCLAHFMRLNQARYQVSATANDTTAGDRTERGLLLLWTFNEMRRLKKIAEKLVQLPKDMPADQTQSTPHAGPPFELPYTLNLPERETARWRTHLDISRAATRLVREQLQAGEPAADPFLEDLLRLDAQDQLTLAALAAGSGVPAASLPQDFQKVAAMLEESVRGFDIGGPHTSVQFWRAVNRDQFLGNPVFGASGPRPIKRRDDGSFSADDSVLIQRLETTVLNDRMPRFRPPVPPERIQFLREWVGRGCPDTTPPSQPGVMPERHPVQEPAPMEPPPAPVGTLSFAAHIRVLFRDSDRDFMLGFGFDLHKYEDVRDQADLIFTRLNDNVRPMPCDGKWPQERIDLFERWMNEGKQP